VNERLGEFQKLVDERECKVIFEIEGMEGVRFYGRE